MSGVLFQVERAEILDWREQERKSLCEQIERRLPELEALIEKDKALIPAEWDEQYKTFAKLTKAEDTARNTYRRSGDQSWEGVSEVLAILRANDDFAALEDDLIAMRATIEGTPPGPQTVIIKFDADDRVRDFAYHTSRF